MSIVKAEYYRLNGNTWEKHYFKTSADLVEGLEEGFIRNITTRTGSLAIPDRQGNNNAPNPTTSYSYAIGNYTQSGSYAIALGRRAIASGMGSIAIGSGSNIYDNPEVLGANSIALGRGTRVINNNSVAIGFNAYTSSDNQIVLGGDNVDTVSMGSNGNALMVSKGFVSGPSSIEIENETDICLYSPGGNKIKYANGVFDLGGANLTNLGNAEDFYTLPVIYGATQSASAAVNKIVSSLDSSNPFTGYKTNQLYVVEFYNGNLATNPTININNSGAKPIRHLDSRGGTTTNVGSTIFNNVNRGIGTFIYDGDYMVLISYVTRYMDAPNVKMTNYSKPSTTSSISALDSVSTAIGKLEKGLESSGGGGLTYELLEQSYYPGGGAGKTVVIGDGDEINYDFIDIYFLMHSSNSAGGRVNINLYTRIDLYTSMEYPIYPFPSSIELDTQSFQTSPKIEVEGSGDGSWTLYISQQAGLITELSVYGGIMQ